MSTALMSITDRFDLREHSIEAITVDTQLALRCYGCHSLIPVLIRIDGQLNTVEVTSRERLSTLGVAIHTGKLIVIQLVGSQ